MICERNLLSLVDSENCCWRIFTRFNGGYRMTVKDDNSIIFFNAFQLFTLESLKHWTKAFSYAIIPSRKAAPYVFLKYLKTTRLWREKYCSAREKFISNAFEGNNGKVSKGVEKLKFNVGALNSETVLVISASLFTDALRLFRSRNFLCNNLEPHKLKII